MRRAEEARWKDESDDELSARLHMDECVRVLGMHHNQAHPTTPPTQHAVMR